MNVITTQPLHHSTGPRRVVIYKARRLLELWEDGSLLVSLPVALGWQPVGHKRREGDGRTPEGHYHACVRNANSKYHLAIGLDYPNRQDADAGLAENAISREQHDRIIAALEAGGRPPWDTALGGEIMIHGGGAGCDWTAGCVALENGSVEYLWERVPIGTDVFILP